PMISTKMKTARLFPVLLTLAVCLTGAGFVQAQSDEDTPTNQSGRTEYLFSGDYACFGGFGGPTVTISPMFDRAGVFFGGGGGVSVNNTFFFGGYGEGLANGPTFDKVVKRAQDRTQIGLPDDAQ